MRNFTPRSRAFNERPIKAGQEAFDGGLTLDLPKSKAKASQITLLENFRNFGEYLEGRGGSINYANVALPAGMPRSRAKRYSSCVAESGSGGRPYSQSRSSR